MGREKEKTIHLEEVIIMKNAKKLIPGAAIALVIAAAAKFLESLEESAGLHFIGASVIAMFIGMIVNAFYKPNSVTAPGIKFTSKKILKFAIILLGASLNIRTVLTVGRFSLTVMVFTGNVLRPWRADRKSNGTELEDEQPHQRRHGYLRRFRDRGNRAGHRGNRYGHCLWPLRNVFI